MNRLAVIRRVQECIVLAIAGLLTLGALPLQAQAAAESAGLSHSVRAFVELTKKFERVSAAELRKAAEAGNPQAQYFWGEREWDAGRAQNSLAFEQWSSKGAPEEKASTPEQSARKAAWTNEATLRKAARAGGPDAIWRVYQLDTDLAHDRARKGFEWIQQAAAQGFPAAEYAVALRNLRDTDWDIIPANLEEGLRWLERAASHGYEPARHRLGQIYIEARVLKPDLAKGIAFLQAAADDGCAHAQFDLAYEYSIGEGEPRNLSDTPVALILRSARTGHASALVKLGNRFRTGRSIGKDFIRAARCFDTARNSTFSTICPGYTTYDGQIFDLVDERLEPKFPVTFEYVKFAEALSLYLKATERSDGQAMARIGRLYLAGKGVPVDRVDGYRWFSRAAQAGNAEGKREADRLRAQLTAEERRKATKEESFGEDDGK